MKLTKYIREAFVRAAMQDVPKPENFESQAHKLIIEDSIAQLPAKVQPLARDNELRFCLRTTNHYFYSSPFASVNVFAPRGADYRPSQAVVEAVAALTEKQMTHNEMRDGLEAKLMAAAMACTTRKALVEMLPEFEKYLPEDTHAAIRTLPAVANIVADFARAGWPKDKTQSKEPANA
jgi:hypothetical protein